ncbi:transcription termination/antitermination protein NusG [Selenihalanaerobacter shriftii]|uniref:Transcription termination/antitermination protein NusG n=1 Tax=Selenihalanaerobacter shriftii TaxID=142842 RepID=A0A1T4QXF5_9FIRM|nr:transcription termination/antitermination protein NusG [Selenihalanaerobacter shriftii]SKA08440.1 transcription antitermination protein nusG [Selenihalanaerobacter shriftii]
MNERKEWYAIHTYSGHEDKVKSNLEKRITTTGMDEKIFNILIPAKDKVKVKNGKKTVSKEKFFPGYVLIEMVMDDDSWYVVRNTPGVIGFASSGTKPIPVSDAEVNSILSQMGVEQPKIETDLKVGDEVKVIDGPFDNFVGDIEEMDLDKGKLTVMVSMFGRKTPVELDFHQVEEV